MLPCGHLANVFWCVINIADRTLTLSSEITNLGAVRCRTKVSKPLPTCEHSATVECYREDLSSLECTATCDKPRGCCGRKCAGRCGDCKVVTRQASQATTVDIDINDEVISNASVDRTHHVSHNCQATVSTCGHLCQYECGSDHTHSPINCRAACPRKCTHGQCELACSVACAPCKCTCNCLCLRQANNYANGNVPTRQVTAGFLVAW
jgi:hypothetical protein